MLKLILHHTYKMNGEAVDISGYSHHGFRTSVPYLVNGIAAGSGVLQFSGGPSRVRVNTTPLWQNLRAVKIETWVKLTALGQRRNLVEGELAFAFFIHPDGVLWGTFLGPETPGGSPTWHGANSAANSPDGATHTVPLNKWTKLTYFHDGVASIRLYIDGKLVAANYNLISAVPSVASGGVHIGHWPGDDRYTFHGEIDEMKIWKFDPEAPIKQFYCRPMTNKQMECWRKAFDNLAGVLGDKEKYRLLIGLMRCLQAAVEDFVRAIRSKGEDAIKRHSDFMKRYRKLWCEGKIDSDEIKRLLREWYGWLHGLLGESYFAGYRRRIDSCMSQFGNLQIDRYFSHLADCDPAFVGYLNLLKEVVEEPVAEPPGGIIDRIIELLKSVWRWLGGIIRPGKT